MPVFPQVRNIVAYYDVLLATKPLRIALDAANEAMDEANAKLEAATEEADTLKGELDLLSDQFNTAEAERQSAIKQVRKNNFILPERRPHYTLLSQSGDLACTWIDQIHSSPLALSSCQQH